MLSIPEEEFYIADTLSRATPEYHGQHPSKLAEEIAQIQHAEWVRKIERSLTHVLTKSET